MSKSIVAIVKGTNEEKMVEEALAHLGGLPSLIKSGATIVIKPNGGHPYPADTSVNTSPGLVAAVIKVLRKAEPKEIILAEASAVGCDTMESLKVSGILKASEDAGIDRIIDIKSDKDLISVPIRDAKSDLKRVLLPRFLIEADHIVNLPIFKSHCSMVFTCALKNIKGTVQDKVHIQMHFTNLAAAMMDLWTVVRADISIADLIRPAEGFGPHHTTPTDFGCIVASKDPVALDATACRMVGLDIDRVPYFKAAKERGLGKFDAKSIEIRGSQIKDVYKKLWLPYLEGFATFPEYDLHLENACSSCQGLIALSLEQLKASGDYEKNAGISVVCGAKKQLPACIKKGKDLILVGDCVKKYQNEGVWVKGCPPGEGGPYWAITDRKALTDVDAARARMEKDGEVFAEYVKKRRKTDIDKSKSK
ncbi:MAG: DUF362 domain-containing protein [Dehalococcoidia bacterium]|jgi:uncharacterized protein (DUF362 family)